MDMNKALEIINTARQENSFTMGSSLEEFIEGFRKRYKLIYRESLPNDYILIAEVIQAINENKAAI